MNLSDKDAERFWSKVRKGKRNIDCWMWTAHITNCGVPQISLNSVKRSAIQVMYELNYGDIPDGHWILRTCGNKACVNPAHLIAVKKGKKLDDWRARRRLEPRMSLSEMVDRVGMELEPVGNGRFVVVNNA